MLGRKKRRKTGAQIARDITDTIVTKASIISKHGSSSIKYICIACIIIFSFSICFGIYGFASRERDILKKENSIENLKNELQSLEKQLAEKQKERDALINDPLAIEAMARSYGMSKKRERVFYFLD